MNVWFVICDVVLVSGGRSRTEWLERWRRVQGKAHNEQAEDPHQQVCEAWATIVSVTIGSREHGELKEEESKSTKEQ